MPELPPKDANSFLVLLHTHEALDELFLLHQEAVLGLELPLATRQLDEFARGLREHIRVEEEILLPLYAQRVERIPRAGPELFSGEHERLSEALARFAAALEAFKTKGLKPRGALEYLDQQYIFKHLAEHHNLREEQYLYPLLDQVTAEDERRELLARCISGPVPCLSSGAPST